VEYALSEEWGIVVSDESPDILRMTLAKVMTDKALRERVGQRAKLLAATQHDAKNVALELCSILNIVVNPKNIGSSIGI
jgi:hypothetical protein